MVDQCNKTPGSNEKARLIVKAISQKAIAQVAALGHKIWPLVHQVIKESLKKEQKLRIQMQKRM